VLELETRSGVENVDRWREVFVPEGPSDSSLAVYCQGYGTKKIRPGLSAIARMATEEGNGMNGYSWRYQIKILH
jgi:hypothetical protein